MIPAEPAGQLDQIDPGMVPAVAGGAMHRKVHVVIDERADRGQHNCAMAGHGVSPSDFAR